MPIITPVASEAWGVKEAMASETDAPEWGSQEERGIDMEVETAMAVIAAGSNAVILKHPESIKIISWSDERISLRVALRRRCNYGT